MIIGYANQWKLRRFFFYQKKMEIGAVNLQFSFLLAILVQLWEGSTDREQHEGNAVRSMGDLAVQLQREAAGGQPGSCISSWADSQGGWQRRAAGESGLPGMAGRLRRGPSSAQHSCLERLSLKRPATFWHLPPNSWVFF